MKVNNIRLLSVFLVSLSLLFNSCTYYYGRKGLNEDLKKPDWKSIELDMLDELKISSPIKYFTVEGLSQEGLYMGLENSRLNGEAQSEIAKENIVVRVNDKDFRIKLIYIERLEIPNEKHGYRDGIISGAIIDLIIIILLIIDASSEPGPTTMIGT